MIEYLKNNALRPKVVRCIDKYLSLSNNQSLTAGFYLGGRLFVMSNGDEPLTLSYDIGSISKTVTAHLILSLAEEGLLGLECPVSHYIDLPNGSYPTIYELLTHTAGYGHLTPCEITVPALLKHGYSRRNIYDGCTAETVVRALAKRKNRSSSDYSYSDFPYAVLAVVAERVTGKSFSSLITDFVQTKLGMRDTVITMPKELRYPVAALGRRVTDYWHWEDNNPYIAGGGLISNIRDMLTYMSIEIESNESYITSAHRLCERSLSKDRNLAVCIGWHTYKRSNQLWHVGGVGTFRSSMILNRKRKIGVVVLGNSKGVASANVHYLAKMLYSEMKINKIKFPKSIMEEKQNEYRL